MASEEFHQAFGRLEGKMDLLVGSLPGIETRLRTLEQEHWKRAGKSVVIAALTSVVMSIVIAFVVKHVG